MSSKSIQNLLPLIQKPSRYLGTEVNRILKDPVSVKLKVALAFPDLYDIGTSHFGIQILYHLLNSDDEVLAERVFAPAGDLASKLRKDDLPLFSLESRRPLGQFDIVGFSLLYELNYTNVLNMLDLANIPLRWKARTADHPLIIAGGPSVCNPEPMADFFDAMVFGDGEEIVVQMTQAWLAWHADGRKDREALLDRWANLDGVYVPRLFKAGYDENNFQSLTVQQSTKPTINRAIVADLDQACFPDRPIIPFGKPIHDRLRLEISRGCSRSCRFCQAGMIYRPVRERSPETILQLIQTALGHTGYEDLSLLSLSTGDYTCLAPVFRTDRIRSISPGVNDPALKEGMDTATRSI